ncbi:hypothetical protein CPB84DRAFT_1846782 [Gymnopilus junonius]|uniref:Uncharacterized protein n=1 Tax=Gymnopilus junonius TaxID=109634 RepID=A0A9P5NLL0_GYMJU|nr:hypothetical protein CPB84DRAFT_1846782 [Gymnopilus junonius]
MAKSSAPSQNRRGAKATSFVFNEQQIKYLDGLRPDFDAFVQRVNPKLKANHGEIREWKRKTSEATMARPEFASLPNSEKPLKAWEEKIHERFTNYYNNTLLSRLGKQSTKSNTRPTINECATSTSSSLPLDNILCRAIGIFMSEAPAWELFAFENADELKAKMEDVKTRHPDLVGGALRNKALAKLWKKADQNAWEEKATTLAGDINAYMILFFSMFTANTRLSLKKPIGVPEALGFAIQNLLQRGRLGSIVTTLNYAFRDMNGGVLYGALYNGYNAQEDQRIDWKFDDHDTRISSWQSVAKLHLPHTFLFAFDKLESHYSLVPPTERRRSEIPINTNGFPIFPPFNLMSATGQQVVEIMQDYLVACWGRSKNSTHDIEWSKIAESPEKFIDVIVFKLPVSLKDPATYSDPADIYTLAKYFAETSTWSVPFHFVDHGSHSSPHPAAASSMSALEMTVSNVAAPTMDVDASRSEKTQSASATQLGNTSDMPQSPGLQPKTTFTAEHANQPPTPPDQLSIEEPCTSPPSRSVKNPTISTDLNPPTSTTPTTITQPSPADIANPQPKSTRKTVAPEVQTSMSSKANMASAPPKKKRKSTSKWFHTDGTNFWDPMAVHVMNWAISCHPLTIEVLDVELSFRPY